ncbi:MAG: hypothetical protein ACI9BD_001521, partial [Candidatus Marinamargulisbacteria bacterium]
ERFISDYPRAIPLFYITKKGKLWIFTKDKKHTPGVDTILISLVSEKVALDTKDKSE